MKKLIGLIVLLAVTMAYGQEDNQAPDTAYKKRVLEATEVDFLTSYYSQDGNNASVTGGVGSEELTDITPTIVVSLPLNADDILTVDAGISAYTSASSSNLDPFDSRRTNTGISGTPWAASSGASSSDVWGSVNLDYSHSSDDRNTIVNGDFSFATEFDYFSIGFGGGITKLFNEKNTTISASTKIYLDSWNPRYPKELDAYLGASGNLNAGFFSGVEILNQDGNSIDKSGNEGAVWLPKSASGLITDKSRNSYSVSLSFSQILNKNAQFSLFFDLVQQTGWLSNPMQRVYFSDADNYYVGNASSIPNYASPINNDVFQLADDIERLPDSRFKIPVGMRLNYFINEIFTMRTYYRFYTDNWGVTAHTGEIEIPVKISRKFTLYPSYRYYVQTAADYFAPFEQHLSTEAFYTSDYDLSKFSSNQFGFGVSYTDIFSAAHIWKLGLKSVDLKYNNYRRNTGLRANIISAGFKFVME